MSKSVQVNGILLNEEIIGVIKYWQSSAEEHNSSIAERYVSYLNDTQDCITRMMLENESDNMITFADILTKLICIKDDLKIFAKFPNREQH